MVTSNYIRKRPPEASDERKVAELVEKLNRAIENMSSTESVIDAIGGVLSLAAQKGAVAHDFLEDLSFIIAEFAENSGETETERFDPCATPDDEDLELEIALGERYSFYPYSRIQ
jgi:predicted Zn-dependent protease